VASTELTTLQNKLVSKIGSREWEECQEELELRQEMQGILKAKIFERSKPFMYTCRGCITTFESFTEIPLAEQFCSGCLGQRSKVPGSIVKAGEVKSGVKGSEAKSRVEEPSPSLFYCFKCHKSFKSLLCG
jgi:hypothetical protein